MNAPGLKLACFAVLVLALNLTAAAGEVAISPLRVELDSQTRISVVELTNTGPEAVTMQAAPVSWQQDGSGADWYEPTDALITFPPMFSIAPGQTQVVRIAAQMPPVEDRERAYRLFFTEIPQLPAEDGPAVLRMRLRISIPAFDIPMGKITSELKLLRAWSDGDNLHMSFRNDGRAHLRASSVIVTTPTDTRLADVGKYLLPGTMHEVVLPLDLDTEVISVDVQTDALGRVTFDPVIVAQSTDQAFQVPQITSGDGPNYSALPE